MTKEQLIIKQILKDLPPDRRLFRINAGMGYAGKPAGVIKERDLMMLQRPRIFRAAPKGWPDLAGWEEIEITPDMVGKKIARFLAVEVKASGSLTKYQKKFREVIEKMGGRYEIIVSLPE